MTTPLLVPLPGGSFLGSRRTMAQPVPPRPLPTTARKVPAARVEALPELPDGSRTARKVEPKPAPAPPPRPAERTGPLLSWERVLLVLLTLHDQDPVDLPSLVVECWRRWPEHFGLRGYPHPDASRVAPRVSTLLSNGLATSNGASAYTPTPKARRLLPGLRARAA